MVAAAAAAVAAAAGTACVVGEDMPLSWRC